MIHTIGIVGVVVTATLLWSFGVLFLSSAVAKALLGVTHRFPDHYVTRDWSVIFFRLGGLLVWAAIGFLVMSQVRG